MRSTMADLEEASEKVKYGPERKSKVVIEKERLITAYHEAGTCSNALFTI